MLTFNGIISVFKFSCVRDEKILHKKFPRFSTHLDEVVPFLHLRAPQQTYFHTFQVEPIVLVVYSDDALFLNTMRNFEEVEGFKKA